MGLENLALKSPFVISGYTFTDMPVLVVRIDQDGAEGRGEAAGVYYLDDDPPVMAGQIEALRAEIEGGAGRTELQTLLPAGGARNALDCALWELEAALAGVPVWRLAGLETVRPLLTTFTLSANTPEAMADGARAYAQAKALKLKLTGEVEADADRVAAVRAARPDVWMGVDANQGFSPDTLEALLPSLLAAQVALVEQPFRRGLEMDLDGLNSPIPIAADESVQSLSDIEPLVGRVQVINIKLDKCGGLTEALAMADEARRLGLKVMVGNMVGSTWAMGPAFVVGQACDVVDLDGPVFIKHDRKRTLTYENGEVFVPDEAWGVGAV